MNHITVKNGRNGHGRSMSAQMDDPDARYAEALRLVQKIDRDLQKGTRHYYDGAGQLLISLDEVINAILNDNLCVDKPVHLFPENEPVRMAVVSEMAV